MGEGIVLAITTASIVGWRCKTPFMRDPRWGCARCPPRPLRPVRCSHLRAALGLATIDSTSSDAFSSRGIAHLKAKQPIAAVADFDADLALSPRSAFALYGRGLAYRSSGDAGGADADIAAAISLDAEIVRKFQKIFEL
jgi:tetratricopeptide (TPR) repeat protein